MWLATKKTYNMFRQRLPCKLNSTLPIKVPPIAIHWGQTDQRQMPNQCRYYFVTITTDLEVFFAFL